jgi:hypothetical protein
LKWQGTSASARKKIVADQRKAHPQKKKRFPHLSSYKIRVEDPDFFYLVSDLGVSLYPDGAYPDPVRTTVSSDQSFKKLQPLRQITWSSGSSAS